MSNTENTYGVFTLERQDLVDLSRRIAACIPADFLKDKDKPVVIAVDGTWQCGKKIVADYGREALLGVKHEDVRFPKRKETEVVPNDSLTMAQSFVNAVKNLFGRREQKDKWITRPLKKRLANSRGVDMACRGISEYDEYVAADVNGALLDVSFINIAWRGDFSFHDDIDDWTEGSLFKHHMNERQAGGVVYVHNLKRDVVEPDIEIKLESKSGYTSLNGEERSCTNVSHALQASLGEDGADIFAEWARFVTVKFNNTALETRANMAKMLKDEFGFCALEQISRELLAIPVEDDSDSEPMQIVVDHANFPLAKKHKHHLAACNNNPKSLVNTVAPCPC